MGGEDAWLGGWPPAPSGAPLYLQKEDHWTHFDNSVNAISFVFVATAILISMFLVMAIFEKFALTSASGHRLQSGIEAHNRIGGFNAKLGYPSPKRPVNAREVSVLMPGDNVPKYIAHPAPTHSSSSGTHALVFISATIQLTRMSRLYLNSRSRAMQNKIKLFRDHGAGN